MKDLSVLILGSGPNVIEARAWSKHPFDKIVAINNAWAVREDWDDLIYPYDFQEERRPTTFQPHQRFVTQEDFVPIQNDYGGFLYAGGTMAFTAGYWVLGHYKPAHIAFLGCDMNYPKTTQTHFYGKGEADPLRKDISLQSLEAKANRLYVHAVKQGCQLTNLSSGPSRLTFPRMTLGMSLPNPLKVEDQMVSQALKCEAELQYVTPSGRYWEEVDNFDPAEITALDQLWMRAVIV